MRQSILEVETLLINYKLILFQNAMLGLEYPNFAGWGEHKFWFTLYMIC